MILDVPYSSQWKDTRKGEWKQNACGVTALKMVLDYFDSPKPIDELYQIGLEMDAYSDALGWFHHGMVDIAQTFGFKGITRSWAVYNEAKDKLSEKGRSEEDIKIMESQLLEEGVFTLKNELEKNHPAIISIPRRFKEDGAGHLVVLVGADENGFIFNDPDDEDRSGEKVHVDFDQFKKVWTRRAIFIEPK